MQPAFSFSPMRVRMSMVDGFPYKEEVSGSSPFVPTIYQVGEVSG